MGDPARWRQPLLLLLLLAAAVHPLHGQTINDMMTMLNVCVGQFPPFTMVSNGTFGGYEVRIPAARG